MPLVEVAASDLEFYEVLGKGSFGSVFRGLWKSQNKEVAIKKMFALENEAEVLCLLSHKNIVQFYGAVVTSPDFCLLTEYAQLGCLYDFLDKNLLMFRRILDWAKDIASGINYLHNEAPYKIIHRDLKSKNVVITSDYVVKLCDFGSSRVLCQTTHMTLAGTFPWMAPEAIQSKPVSEKCDAFSYGVVLWEMLTSEVPFKGFEVVHVAWLVVVKEERLVIPDSCPPVFSKLLRRLWHTDPQERPDFTEIKRILESMDEDGALEDETNSFIEHKAIWKKRMEETLHRLKDLEKNLVLKEQELEEREVQLQNKEKRLSHQGEVPNNSDLQEWTDDDVYVWMQQLGNEAVDLVQYAELFYCNHINGRRLLMLGIEDLKWMGIYSYGHRMDLYDQITKLKDEMDHLLHFPPLDMELLDQQPAKLPTISLTLLFGNHCRLGASLMDHKWKMYLEVDGEDQALTCIKSVTFHLQSTIPIHTVNQPPYVMERWQSAGDDNAPIIVDCVVTYESKVKKPKSTKHTHEVILKEGGSVFQKSVQLTLKQSAAALPNTQREDDPSASMSSGISSATSSRKQSAISSRLSFTNLDAANVSRSSTPDTWASKVRSGFPKSYSPRPISTSSQEVLMRKREKDSPKGSQWQGQQAFGFPKPAQQSPSSKDDSNCAAKRPIEDEKKIQRKSVGNERQSSDNGWQVVTRTSKPQTHRGGGFQRSRSDNPSSGTTKPEASPRRAFSETDYKRQSSARGRGRARGRARGDPQRGRGTRR